MYEDNSLNRSHKELEMNQKSIEKAIKTGERRKQFRIWMQIKYKIAKKFKQKYKVGCTQNELEQLEINQLQKVLVKRRIKKRNHRMAIRIQKLFRGFLGWF